MPGVVGVLTERPLLNVRFGGAGPVLTVGFDPTPIAGGLIPPVKLGLSFTALGDPGC